MTATTAPRLALAAVLLLTALLGTRDITDGASVMLGADMSRYMMNGVFVYDLVASGGVWSIADLTSFAERYFARYPALSLGHHPPVPYLAVVPFYVVFGISVLAARLAALCWFLLAAWSLYVVGRRMYDWRVGAWASALFVTNVMALRAGQYLLSEMPMTVLVLMAFAALLGWCQTRRGWYFAGFVAAAGASVYAKQLAVLMLPVYVAVIVGSLGWRRVATRRTMLAGGIVVLLATPMVVMSVDLAPANVAWVRESVVRLLNGSRQRSVVDILGTIVTAHLTWPAMLAAVLGTALAARRHVWQSAVGLVWIATLVGGSVVFVGPIEPARYAFGALPAYYLLAASATTAVSARVARAATVVLLGGVFLWQGWMVRNVRPSGAGGYEAAAQFVVEHSREPVVLFHGMSDTGYFVFFVRQHDSAQRMVVMRAEKLLPATDESITTDKLYADLQRFGIQFVVVEEREADTIALRMLHRELETERFVERTRIPVLSREPSARGVDLIVYEYLNARAADPDAEVDIGVWRANRTIRVPMRDLLATVPK